MTHLLFLPDPAKPRFFLWGDPAAGPAAPVAVVSSLAALGAAAVARIVNESLAVAHVEGTAIPLLDALPLLAALTADEAARGPASLSAWSLATKLALELVGRERIVPSIRRAPDGKTEARWRAALTLTEDAERMAALANAFPPAAHAVPVDGGDTVAGRAGRHQRAVPPVMVWTADALLHAFLDAAADAIARAAAGGAARGAAPGMGHERAHTAHTQWEFRWHSALTSSQPAFEPTGFQERGLLAELEAWATPALGASGVPRGCFRLELPDGGDVDDTPPRGHPSTGDLFSLRYFLQAADDPSLLVPAEDVWSARGRRLRQLGCTFEEPQEHLLRSLAMAARIFRPVERSLRQPRPALVTLDGTEAWTFLTEGAPALAQAGLGVIVPAELTRSGQRRLRLRMRLGASGTRVAGAVSGAGGLGLEDVIAFRWEAALGDEALSAADLAALSELKRPLVRWRGQWVALDPAELDEARRALAQGDGTLAARNALTAALAGEAVRSESGLPVQVTAEGRFADVLDRLKAGPSADGALALSGFRGTLRPYQERGTVWLASMASLGLGACLADDMGLGKTVQVLAWLLHGREAAGHDARPALLVCPTSVVGNWEREIARFTPSLAVIRHYGGGRARSAAALVGDGAGAIVLTTYGLLRRDTELLSGVDWSAVILDEAQNIKNAASRTARAARALRASHRFALTGTPVENRLAELWSILEFATPGLLGPLETFRRTYAVPIERYADGAAAERLRRIVGPFILRRLKSDPAIIQDLPPKQEMKIVCSLTKEQATLYQAAVSEAMRKIEESDGIQRRGLVLALIMALKQICNHPAHYLREAGPLGGRSGKLARLTEMLEEALAEGDRALVFTQFREMGDRLVVHLTRALGAETLFLHGGVSRAARDAMVRRFQEDERGPRIFVLSVKAGGTGLNLTAASHVFHFDRWWNPAVEDQATDRAYRIGQTRLVQVHKLLAAGTVEEKVDRLLEEKRDLAARIVGAGERWITELDNTELRDLFALSADAVVGEEEAEDEGGETREQVVARPKRAPRSGAPSMRRAGKRQ